MNQPADAFEFLEELYKQNGKETRNISDVARYLSFKARDKGVPFCGQFELTPLCNLDCKMCYVHLDKEQIHNRSVLSVETWKDLMHQAWEAGMCRATLTGGECLAYPGFEELFLYLHSLGCEVAVLTNGLLLDEKRICFFTEHKPCAIQVTIYGQNDDVYERVTGRRVFKTVSDHVHKAIDAKLPVSIAVTPNVFLGEDVFDTLRLCKSFGHKISINQTIFPPREETGRAEQRDDLTTDMYVRIYRLMHEMEGRKTREIAEEKLPPYGSDQHECTTYGLRCGGGRSSFVMDWQGTVMPCNWLNMIRSNALEEGFSAAWHHINHEANRWPQVPECKNCAYQKVCNTCTANMISFAEAGKQPIQLCEQTRKFVQHGVMHIPDCE